jgi:NAD(P)H-dependent FMN reductase
MLRSSTPILRLAIVTGSTRQGRFGPQLSQWFEQIATDHGLFEVDVVDLADFGFPNVSGEGHPKQGVYSDQVAPFAARMAAADAFVFVTPEYNHGYPASLKAALDAIYLEWNNKPASFLAYGGAYGGVRAVEQLRQVMAELQIADIQQTLAIPKAAWGFFNEDGSVKDESTNVAAKSMLEQLAWWAAALKAGREVSSDRG